MDTTNIIYKRGGRRDYIAVDYFGLSFRKGQILTDSFRNTLAYSGLNAKRNLPFGVFRFRFINPTMYLFFLRFHFLLLWFLLIIVAVEGDQCNLSFLK